MSRINPLETAGVKSEETARKNAIDDLTHCPAENCGKLMEIVEANGHKCFVCEEHRIALPCPE